MRTRYHNYLLEEAIHSDSMLHAPMKIVFMMTLCKKHARLSISTRNTNMNIVRSSRIHSPNHKSDSRLSCVIINT